MAIQKITRALWASSLLLSYSKARSIAHTSQHHYPTREIAGISVINTPLVQAAEAFASEHSSHAVYKHVMRSWLYGVLMLDANQTLSQSVDVEVHAVATLLHDLGWDMAEDSTFVSTDKRFEVDGAFAAREFIHQHGHAKEWDERKVQLVWDAIALHTEPSIAYFKEVDVQVVSKGISMDFSGPAYDVPEGKYAAVAKAYPKNDLKDQVNQTIIWLCATKPQTTYGGSGKTFLSSSLVDHILKNNTKVQSVAVGAYYFGRRDVQRNAADYNLAFRSIARQIVAQLPPTSTALQSIPKEADPDEGDVCSSFKFINKVNYEYDRMAHPYLWYAARNLSPSLARNISVPESFDEDFLKLAATQEQIESYLQAAEAWPYLDEETYDECEESEERWRCFTRGYTPIHLAAHLGIRETTIQMSIDSGVDLEACTENGQTASHMAAEIEDDSSTLRRLLQCGSDVAVVDHDNRTPLSHAIIYGNLTSVELLLEHGADIGAVDEEDLLECLREKPEIAQFLVGVGVEMPEDDEE
ncbi:hypothetical protein HG530_006927 [Fusarium avenaceum]|nr:hypothetical protein HG530_006927 [Fusarium avenaceum]